MPRLPVLSAGGTSSPGAGTLGAGAVGAGAVGLGAAGAGTAGAAAAGAGARPDCVPACSPMLPFPPVAAGSVAAAAGSPLVTSASGCGDMRSVSNRPATRPKPSVTSHPFTIPRVPRTLRERLEPRRDGTGPDRVSIALTSSDADIRTHHDLTTPGQKRHRPTPPRSPPGGRLMLRPWHTPTLRSVRPSVLDCHADRAGACGHRPDGGIAGGHPSPLTISGRCDVTARDASMRVRDGAGSEGHRRHCPYHLRPRPLRPPADQRNGQVFEANQ